MKYLSDYIGAAQSELFDRMGIFFAFSNEQLAEKQKDGIEYVSLGMGMICPKDNTKQFLQEHNSIVDTGMKQDLAENSREGVILRELENHECFYTGDYMDCFPVLDGYGITEDEIKAVYNKGQPVL